MKKNKIPMRRCIGCMESKPKQNLIRIACYETVLTVDVTGRAKGRGVYLCKDAACIALAKKKRALQRNFSMNFAADEVERIFAQLEAENGQSDGKK